MKKLPENKKLSEKEINTKVTLCVETFSKNWLGEATKIVQLVKKSSKPGHKILLGENPQLFNTSKFIFSKFFFQLH